MYFIRKSRVHDFVQRGLSQFQIVVVQVLVVGFLEGFIVFFQLEQILVDILLFVDFDQHTGNVGTMVGNAFDIGEQILIM